ncbi:MULTISPECIES: HAMP domain-containing sensor histidine kinase [unclassified Mucilaginibacter]|uniref:sensor histidine kinase n=1 Tax=unclassified Mucilaginibacter TaxID=2617802 RepID=UPI002AC9352B|nr:MULTISPECIES: HAMP domain-containing sensor histidine kinase [unclassified Mucilaginibacter]MEB0262842.1 HAMP domain-containing sensor histidine kinase [Mucilaginibacter sp. 10I4]MEB0277681.1 HAMP domain-containing sensor histidine kinase [Mucilaginibacter sp. 10B2]MEB0301940.1 HAMP domain-containing sensor histidine kinase [Mucilaginibacter sp. 5C4]WPX24692.1 HAMP domain-containing sensor histidine kinase [Mucilaginibacter sp. 5C4]
MKKTLVIFYAIIIYAVAELIWWGYMLVHLNPSRKGMILGEGCMFVTVFLVGAYFLHESLNKEAKLQVQKKNFLLSVTHELKSPLASIKILLQTIQKRDLAKAQILNFIDKSLLDVERLDDMVENMLLASKIDNRSYSFPKAKFNLSVLVDSIVNRLQISKCDCNQQIINAEIEPKIEITGDKFALTSVVTNLVENAVKYSSPCETVNVKLFEKEGKVYFQVADHGIGIADNEKPRIFDKFYRVGSEDTRNTKGTGLGLYIVKEVLDKHQASIKVKDNRPAGSVFEVVFALT